MSKISDTTLLLRNAASDNDDGGKPAKRNKMEHTPQDKVSYITVKTKSTSDVCMF